MSHPHSQDRQKVTCQSYSCKGPANISTPLLSAILEHFLNWEIKALENSVTKMIMAILTYRCCFSSCILTCNKSGASGFTSSWINFETSSLYPLSAVLEHSKSLLQPSQYWDYSHRTCCLGKPILSEVIIFHQEFLWGCSASSLGAFSLPDPLYGRETFLKWQFSSFGAVNSWSMPIREDMFLEDSSNIWTSCPFSHYRSPFLLSFSGAALNESTSSTNIVSQVSGQQKAVKNFTFH